MTEYPLLDPNLPLIRIEDEVVLIDTGASHSVWDRRPGSRSAAQVGGADGGAGGHRDFGRKPGADGPRYGV